DGGMRLEALEFLERCQIRILVVQMNHEADRNQIVVEMVEERAAARRAVERPAERMLHKALPVLFRLNLPQLLQADAVFLRLASFGKAEAGDQLLGERSACTL